MNAEKKHSWITHRQSLTAAELVNQEIAAVRTAWRLTPPAEHYRDPRWFRLAVFAAVRAGRLPRVGYCLNAIDRLRQAGFGELLDHPGVIRLPDGRRIVIGEPYWHILRIAKAQAMADELAGILGCRAWVSLKSWHYPGRTIRVAFSMGKPQ